MHTLKEWRGDNHTAGKERELLDTLASGEAGVRSKVGVFQHFGEQGQESEESLGVGLEHRTRQSPQPFHGCSTVFRPGTSHSIPLPRPFSCCPGDMGRAEL